MLNSKQQRNKFHLFFWLTRAPVVYTINTNSSFTRTHLCVSWFYASKEDLDFAKARHLHRRLRSDTQRVNKGLFKGKDPPLFSRDMLQSGLNCAITQDLFMLCITT